MTEFVGAEKPSLDELSHHGVKGMKWGVRKERPTGSGNPSYSVDKEGRITIEKGYQLQRVFDSKVGATSGSTGANYFSFTPKDKNIYVQMMGAGIDSKFNIIRKLASDKISVTVAKEPLKSPSRKEAFDTLKESINQAGAPKGIRPFDKDFTSKGAEAWYQEANAHIVKDKNSSFNQVYYGNLRKKGYNMLLDEADSGFLSELPVIVLDGAKSLRPLSVSDLSGKDVKAAKSFLKDHGGTTIKSLNESSKDSGRR